MLLHGASVADVVYLRQFHSAYPSKAYSGILRTGTRCTIRVMSIYYAKCHVRIINTYTIDFMHNCLISLAVTWGVVWRDAQGQKEPYNEENDR